MDWLTGFVVFEVAFTTGLCLLGWSYQESKTEVQKTADLLRDTDDPRLASYLDSVGGPPMTAWDLLVERVPADFLVRKEASSLVC